MFNKKDQRAAGELFHLGVSRHKAVDVVVDLLEYEASVHEGEAALSKKISEHTLFHFSY